MSQGGMRVNSAKRSPTPLSYMREPHIKVTSSEVKRQTDLTGGVNSRVHNLCVMDIADTTDFTRVCWQP